MANRNSALIILLSIEILMISACGSSSQALSGQEAYSPEIDPANFVDKIDNPHFPLTPGITMIYEGETDEGLEHIEDAVTQETKEILDVTCIVVWNRVTLDGELVEETFDWYAQDRDGNVWYFGGDTKEYEAGSVVSTAGSWEAGVDGALLGIIMKADPQVGETYRQEYYQGEAEDMAEVVSLTESDTVAYVSYDDLLVTKEWTPLEPGISEHKSYAKGVGMVLEKVIEGGSGRIELVNIVTKREESHETTRKTHCVSDRRRLRGPGVLGALYALERGRRQSDGGRLRQGRALHR